MNKWLFLLKMHKENNGQYRGKNEKLCKVKRAGESNRTQVIDRTEYYNLNLNHTAIIINRKNWRITIKLHFGNLRIFFKKRMYTHARSPLPLFVFVHFSMTHPSPPQRTYFLNDSLASAFLLFVFVFTHTSLSCILFAVLQKPCQGNFKVSKIRRE